MYSVYVMVSEYLRTGNLHWFLLFYIFILIRWAIVFFASLRYKPYCCEPKAYFIRVIIPVVDEPVDFFRSVLDKVIEQKPGEIIVVVNGPENEALRGMVRQFKTQYAQLPEYAAVQVKALYTPVPGKRNAIRLGLEHADQRSEITVLVDSDVLWTRGMLANLMMPFSCDPLVGGVTTRQKIFSPSRNLITMICSVLEEIRAEGTMKAMSATGKVGCLPGRTIAYRTQILREAMPEFMTETFLGIHKEVSDDRSLTNITLKRGYKTVMQDTAVVYTDAPVTWRKFCRQQLRWAEGSQYNNLRMTGWMLQHAKLMCFIFWSDMLMPFLLASVYTNLVLCSIGKLLGFDIQTAVSSASVAVVIAFIFLGSILGYGIRNIRTFSRLPVYYIFLIPVLTLFLSMVLAPIRILGLARCADDLSWGTRDLEGGEGK